jgi:transcriptional regulator with XRE-family HTH domain
MAVDERAVFGDLLRHARRATGLTQEELAELAGLSARGISDLERGVVRAPHRETLDLLADALELAPDERRRWEQTRRRLSARAPPDSRARDAPAAGATFPHLPTPLVGRERELGSLHTVLESALAGHGRLVLISGEAGIGKTALAGALAHEAIAAGALVLLGHCYDLTMTPPYGPWMDITDQYRSDRGRPALPDVLKRGTGIGDLDHQVALFEEARTFFAAVAQRHPTVLVLEDLHWSDPASLDLLRYLARHLQHHAILLVATYRSDEVTAQHPLYPLLPLLVREANAERLDLHHLSDEDVQSLVDGRYQLPVGDAARLAAYLGEHAEGNPLYIREVLRTLEEEGLMRLEHGKWMLGEFGQIVVPALIQQVITRRAERLSEESRGLLSIAAVIGQEAPVPLWGEVAAADDEALLVAIEEAVAAHFLEAARDGTGVRFVHALVREAFYESILPIRRRRWHQQVAERLVALHQPDPDEVAYHFQQAGDERAVNWLIQAGERAQRTYAWRSAIERFSAAIRLMENDTTRARERGWLLHRTGRMLRLSRPSDGVELLQKAERVGRAVGDAVLAAYSLVDRGLVRCFDGDPRRGIGELIAGVEAVDRLPTDYLSRDPAVAIWIADALRLDDAGIEDAHASRSPRSANVRRSTLALWLAEVGRHAEAITIGEACRTDIASGVQLTETEAGFLADALFALGLAYAELGRFEEADEALTAARETYRSYDHHELVAGVIMNHLWLVTCPYTATDLEQRRWLADEAEAAQLRSRGALDTAGMSPTISSSLPLAFFEGAWDAARDAIAAGRAALGLSPWREWTMCVQAWVAWGQGDTVTAWEQVRAMLPEGPATEPGGQIFGPALELQSLAINLSLDQGDLDRTHVWLEMYNRWVAWGGAVRRKVDAHLLRARYYHASGDMASAHNTAQEALTLASDPQQPLALIAAHRFLGHLDTECSRHAEAELHLGEALRLADACAAPFERALTLLTLAELRMAQDEPDAARALAGDVRAICEPLGARPTLERVDALLQLLGTTPEGAVARPTRVTSR